MTILEAIHRVDALRHNVFTQEEKIGWLAQVDGLVTEDLIRTHEAGEGQTLRTYDAETPLEQQLLVPAPFIRRCCPPSPISTTGRICPWGRSLGTFKEVRP